MIHKQQSKAMQSVQERRSRSHQIAGKSIHSDFTSTLCSSTASGMYAESVVHANIGKHFEEQYKNLVNQRRQAQKRTRRQPRKARRQRGVDRERAVCSQ